MSDKIVDAAVKLLEQGGTAAMWMWFAYLSASLIKFVIAFGSFVYAVKKLYDWGMKALSKVEFRVVEERNGE